MKRQFFIAGVKFRPVQEIREVAKLMKVGDHLGLVPEPTNRFDPNAVKIEYNTETADGVKSTFLGYVPKKFSSEVSGMLSIGAEVDCIVDEITPDASTWEMFKVTVSIPVDEEESDDDEEEDESEEGVSER